MVNRLLGSVTAEVLRHADGPVLVTRADTPALKEAGPMRAILVEVAGTPFAEAGVSFRADTGLGREANILLAQAVEAGPPIPALDLAPNKSLEQLQRDARRITEGHTFRQRPCPFAAAALPSDHRRW